MKLAVVGSRGFKNVRMMHDALDLLHAKTPITLIVSGGAAGADTLAECWAALRNIPTHIIRPDWDKHGRAAGMIRNGEIVAASDAVLAFWDGKSRGTKNTIDRAKSAGKPCKVITTEVK